MPRSCRGAAARGPEPGRAAGLGELAHAQDVALALGHRDHAAGVEQVEDVACLDALVVGRQRHRGGARRRVARPREYLRQAAFRVAEVAEQHLGVGVLEIVPRVFLLGLQEDVAIGDLVGALAAVEVELEAVVDALQVHGEALEAVGELARDRRAFEARDLLEVGELRHLHAVAPALPAEPPGAERRALPVVLDEADVVQQRVEADRLERARDRAPAGSGGFGFRITWNW